METCQSRKPKSVYLVIVTHRSAKISKFSALLVWLSAKKQKIRPAQSCSSAETSINQKFCCDRLFDSRKKRNFEMLSLFNNYWKVFQDFGKYLTVLMQSVLLPKHDNDRFSQTRGCFHTFFGFSWVQEEKELKKNNK